MAKILLVDDNFDLLEIQRIVLGHAGHEVVTARDGKEALWEAGRATFSLLITDVIMPEVDGLDIIIALRHRQPDLKIIAVTGGGQMNAINYLEIARKLGAVGTLAKPVSGPRLLEAVASALNLEVR
jgi:CheY-like chemotaxis protein